MVLSLPSSTDRDLHLALRQCPFPGLGVYPNAVIETLRALPVDAGRDLAVLGVQRAQNSGTGLLGLKVRQSLDGETRLTGRGFASPLQYLNLRLKLGNPGVAFGKLLLELRESGFRHGDLLSGRQREGSSSTLHEGASPSGSVGGVTCIPALTEAWTGAGGELEHLG